MFIDERTREEVSAPKSAGSLVLGRREGEGVLVCFGQLEMIMIVEETRSGKCAIRFLCPAGIDVHRIKPVSHES